MTDIYHLQVKISATGVELVNASKAGKQALSSLGTQGQQAGEQIDKGSRTAATALSTVNVAAKAAALGITALGTAWAGINFAKTAYESTQAMARLSQGLTAVKGSAQAAATDIAYLRKLATESGRTVQDLGKDWLEFSASLEGAGVSSAKQQRLFEQLTKTFAILGKTSAESSLAIRGAQQVVGSGNANLEDLKQVAENAGLSMSLFAQAAGLSMADFKKAVSPGTISGIGLLERFSELVSGKFKGALNQADRSAGELAQAWDDVKLAFGEDFVPGVADGMKALASTMKDPAFIQAMKDLGNYLGGGLKTAAEVLPSIVDRIRAIGAGALAGGVAGLVSPVPGGALLGAVAGGYAGYKLGGSAPRRGAMADGEVAAALKAAGFPDRLIPTMLAIGKAESRLRPSAHNPDASTGDNSYGLFQINMLGALGPARRRQFGIADNDALYDPATNAKAAYAIYQEQGLAAWSTYKRGDHRKFLGSSSPAPASVNNEPMSPLFIGNAAAKADKQVEKLNDRITELKESLRAKGAAIGKGDGFELFEKIRIDIHKTMKGADKAAALTELAELEKIQAAYNNQVEVRKRDADATRDQAQAKDSAAKAASAFIVEQLRETELYGQATASKEVDKIASDLIASGQSELATKFKATADSLIAQIAALDAKATADEEAKRAAQRHAEAQASFNAGIEDQIRSYQVEREAMRLATGEGEAYRVTQEAIFRAKKDGLEINNAALAQLQMEAKLTEEVRSAQAASEEIRRSLTDALLRGFESGKDFARNFRDTLLNMFKTLVLRPIIEPIAGSAANTLLGVFGIGKANGALTSGRGSGGFNALTAIDKVGSSLGNIGKLFSGSGAGYSGGGIASIPAGGSQLLGSFGLGGLTKFLPGIGSAMGAFGVGAAGSNLLGGLLGTGQSGTGQIGSLLGSLAGAVLGPLGSIGGGVLGGLLGDLFKPGPPKSALTGYFGPGNVFSGQSSVKNGGQAGTTSGPSGQLVAALQNAAAALGIDLNGTYADVTANKGKLQIFSPGHYQSDKFDPEDLQNQIAKATKATISHVIGRAQSYIQKAFANSGGDINFAAQVKTIYESLVPAKTAAATVESLKQQIIGQAITNGWGDPSWVNNVKTLDQAKTALKGMIEAGFVVPENLALWTNLIKNMSDGIADLSAQGDKLKGAYDAVNGYVLSAKNDFVSALKQEAANDRAYFRSLRDFRAGLVTSGQSGALPQEQLVASRKTFRRLARQARGGDLSAIPDLQNAASAYLDSANRYFGGTASYDRVFRNVDTVLGNAQAAARQQARDASGELRGLAPDAVRNKTLDDLRQAFLQSQKLTSDAISQYALLQQQIDDMRKTGATLSPETETQLEDLIKTLGTLAEQLRLRNAA